MKKIFLIAAVAMIVAASCSRSGQWHVKGNVDGAKSQDMLVQAASNGRWYTLDTIKIDSRGDFAYSHDAVGYPDIYRLNLGGRYIYFPIDSIESVDVKATESGFDNDYTISGSQAADMMMSVDNRLREAVAAQGEVAVVSDSLLKRELGGMIVSDPAGIVSYYIISKQINGRPIFNPSNPVDNRIFGAVANAFNEFRPNDPRTRYLRNIYLTNRPYVPSSTPGDTIVATEIDLFDVALTDNKGVEHNLRDVAANNKVVVLNFTAYTADASPAFNIELAKIYEKRHPSGMEIYQIAVDSDEFQWKQSAKNLPWVTVYNPLSTGAEVMMKYNVQALPTTYLIVNGELVDRVDNILELDSKLNKYL